MRLPVKLSLLLAAATTGPLVLATVFVLPRGAQALRERLDALYAQDARSLAAEVHRGLVDKLEAVTLAAGTLRLDELDPDAREQALLLLYKETKGADVVGLFDARGDELATPVRFSHLPAELTADHEEVSDEGLAAYAKSVPLDAALHAGLAIGPVYMLQSRGAPMPRIVLAAALPGKTRSVLAVELSLRPVADAFQGFQPGQTGAAFLVDGNDRVIVHRDTALMAAQADLSGHPLVGGDSLGAVATVPLLGWKAVVVEPARDGLMAVRGLEHAAGAWIAVGLLLAFFIGFTTVRTVTRPVNKLRGAAVAIAGGALETTVEERGNDELAQLARAFNSMTRGLREREELRLTLALSSTLELSQVLGRLLDSVGRVVPFERAAVLVRRGEGYELAAVRGHADDAEARSTWPAAGEVAEALRAREAVRWKSRLAVPLLSRGAAVGIIGLEGPRGYTEEQARVAFAFTQPAVVAVENARLFDEVQRLATIDGLTGVLNRRHFMQLAEAQALQAQRFGQPLSLLMLDIDHFKSVNDTHGHAVGDEVLRTVAQRCQACLRSIDLLGRYGGEEFAVLLPMTTRKAALEVLAERLRAAALPPIVLEKRSLQVTLSVGVAGNDEGSDLPGLFARADAALYEAKQAGRNRVA